MASTDIIVRIEMILFGIGIVIYEFKLVLFESREIFKFSVAYV